MTDEREWGPWSVWKTEILLGGYLPLFTRAAAKGKHRTFIDCFAGVTRNVERITGREIKSSPRQALEATPPFTHLLAFELPDNATRLEHDLQEEFPNRSIRVIAGDCNQQIGAGLDWWFGQGSARFGPYLGPTLAYLDPNSMELAWSTVAELAAFGKAPPTPGAYVRQKGPVEMLILFPTGPLKRSLPQPGKAEAKPSACAKVDRLFGSDCWRPIYADQRAGVIKGEDSWSHYVNLYRYRLEQIGYSYTSAIEVRNTRGVVVYHMVFATGHVAGQNIMDAVMDRARAVLPQLLEQERQHVRSAGNMTESLFSDQEWEDELSAAADDPSRYARLLIGQPGPYVSGTPSVQEQLHLDWS